MNQHQVVKKDAQIHIRLTATEKNVLARLATRNSMSLSEFLLSLARTHDGYWSIKKDEHGREAAS